MKFAKVEETLVAVILVAVSALLWLALGRLNGLLSPLTEFSPGIDLVYLPAGFRLGIVVAFRLWGAIGIALANPLVFTAEFGEHALPEIVINSLICGFVPLMSVIGASRLLGIDSHLGNLLPIHLPSLAFAVSVATPLALNVSFAFFNYKSGQDIWANLSAMIMGDFLGCLVVLVVMRTAIYAWRTVSRVS